MLTPQALDLASRQHGVLAVFQGPEVGMAPAQLRRSLQTSGWWRVSPRIFRRTGSPRTPGQVFVEGVLDTGSAARLSHEAGASWWGVPGFDAVGSTVTTTTHSRRSAAVDRLHVARDLPEAWTTVLDGVPICRPELVMLQLCATVHPRRAERALDTAWSMRLLGGPSLCRLLDEMGASGRNGTRVLRSLVDQRGPDYVPPASNLEDRTAEILRRAGLGEFRVQVDVGSARWTGRVDLVHPVLPVIVEVQSERFHSSLSDVRSDRERIAQLEADGFVVVEATDTDVWQRAERVVAAVGSAVTEAHRRTGRTPHHRVFPSFGVQECS